ncbi:hypothetical protein [Streptomyces sp. VNUA24]|uniref:hypothetical protein n=1 Tax=Streptomyces sp. VNUA24 TaxID=3031131 RepID=UPI0023B87DBD|nr:hypothetical protein [Streptomyces sp. VNUA24]WEH15053.1 hypothetical protein PYR72_15490 [Streptomyces sp. VNUA24]
MSSLVEVFVREPDGRRRILDVPDDVHRSGGFESWRTTVWGSEFVRSLDARFLPVPGTRSTAGCGSSGRASTRPWRSAGVS